MTTDPKPQKDWQPIPTITITIDKMGLADFARLLPGLGQFSVAPAESPPSDTRPKGWETERASEAQVALLNRKLENWDLVEELAYGVTSLENLTKKQASEIIKRLQP